MAPHQPEPPRDATELFWALTLDHDAVTLATEPPYDAIQLTATPRDGTGAPLAGLGPVTFRPLDSLRVQVSPDGLVRALRTGTGIRVVAELAAGNVRHADTVFINVTSGTPRLPASLSIDPVPPDSAKWSVTGSAFLSKFLTARLADADGMAITGVSVHYSSSDTLIVKMDRTTGRVSADGLPGEVTIYASATAYGVSLADTLPFVVTMPVAKRVDFRQSSIRGVGLTFEPSEVTISTGGVVLFFNLTLQQVDVIFEDPTNVLERVLPLRCPFGTDPGGAGNIAPFGGVDVRQNFPGNCKSRRFPVPGVYPFHSTLTGATGRVVVTDGLPQP